MAIKKRRIKSAEADTEEKVRIYGINSLTIADTVYEAENDSIQGNDNASGHDSK